MQSLLVRRSISAVFGVLFALTSTEAAAQGVGTVTGTVVDLATSQPITGAQVYFPGLSLGSITTAQGRFLILNVPAGPREIQAELIGRQTSTQNVTVVAGQTVEINFMLESRAISLEGLVATGVAAATPRTQLAFTVDQVRVEPAQVSASLNVGSMIQGRMAGAKIIQSSAQPGEAPSIQLRGPKSITGSQEPLVIVDGVISRGSLADIDPNDIESIEVVKGAAAASLYGSRAQAGVIQITTKRGSFLPTGRTEFTVRSTFQKNSVEHVIPMALSHEYRMTPDGTAFVNRAGQVVPLPAQRSAFALDDGAAGTDQFKTFKDNAYPASIFTGNPYRQLMTPGNAYSTYFSVSANEGNTQYRISGRLQRDEGAVAFHDGARQTNFRANVDQRIGEQLSVSLSTYLTNMTQDVSVTPDSRGSVFDAIDEHSAAIDYFARDADGTLAIIGDPVSLGSNPLYQLDMDEHSRETQRIMLALDATYTPTSWLTLESNVSFDRDDRQESFMRPAGFKRINNPPLAGSMNLDQRLRRDINASVTASLARNFGDLTTRTRFRWLVEDGFNKSHYVGSSDFAVVGVPRLALLTGTPTLDSQEQQTISQGFFAITALTWRERYIVDVLGRRDGSSLFGADERWQNYFRLATAWRMAEEAWWPFESITEFKPRYSIGTAGGRPGYDYQYQTYAVEPGRIVPKILGNNKLKPEISTEQEFGLDAVIADRFSIQANYVRSRVDDQLLLVPSSAAMGFESQWQNAGTVEATTWEGVFEMAFAERADFLWTGRLNLDRTTQKITKLGVPPYELVNRRLASANHNRILIKEGESLGTFYGVRWAHDCAIDLPANVPCDQFQVNDDGFVVYVGSGNDYRDGVSKDLWGTVATVNGVAYDWGMPIRSIVEDGFTRIGTAQPELSVSFAQDVQWKDVGFTFLLDGEFGGNIYNQSRQWGSRTSVASIDQRNKPEELKKPLPYYGAAKLYAGNIRGDWFVEKGDFIKVRELSLRYTLREAALPAFLKMSRATFNLTGRNLKTFTSYVGADPEVGLASFGGSAAVGRIDEYFYPNYRSFGLDVELVF